MDRLTRRVISRFREDTDEKPPEKSWMEYVQDKAVGVGKPPEAVFHMLDEDNAGNPPITQYNPYDYEDPSGKPKDQKGPPLVVTIDPSIDYGLFQDPKVFKDQGELGDWQHCQEQDFTTDENEQNPAISITRKYAMVQNVIARHMLDCMPIVVPEPEFDDLFLRTRVAASLSEIVDKDYHYKNDLKLDRSGSVVAVWMNKNNQKQRESGLFIFRVSSPGATHGPHTVYLQFLRGDGEGQFNSYAEYPVQLACTCPSFLYHGAQYYAVHGKYMYMPAFRPDLAPPRMPNTYVIHRSERYPMGKRFPGRGLNFRVCKHLLKVYDLLKTMKVETYYRKYPVTAPPSKVMNAEEWKRLMKFDFTEANIKQRLRSPRPKIPAYFNRENLTQSVIDWFNQVWIPRSDDQKVKALNEMVEYPERIFFILMKEAYLKRSRGEQISDRLINEGYDLMSRVVQPENKETPQQVEMEGMPQDLEGKGTGAVAPPGGDVPADEFIKGEVTTPSTVQPATKPMGEPVSKPMQTPKFSPEKARDIAKKLRGVKRDE